MSTVLLPPEDHERAADALRDGTAHFTSDAHSSGGARRIARHEKDEWDKQIEEDAKAGRLDELMEEARRDHREGNTKPLP
jgi:hypothetical protein